MIISIDTEEKLLSGFIPAGAFIFYKSQRTFIRKVTIGNMSFEEIIERYDKKDTLFYLDPPYYGAEKYYQERFLEENHIKLAEMLKGIEGKFILSYNDCEYIRELYSQFNVEGVERLNNLGTKYKNDDRKYRELIIRNY